MLRGALLERPVLLDKVENLRTGTGALAGYIDVGAWVAACIADARRVLVPTARGPWSFAVRDGVTLFCCGELVVHLTAHAHIPTQTTVGRDHVFIGICGACVVTVHFRNGYVRAFRHLSFSDFL